MDLQLKNRIAFVAASSKGLGKAVALELAKEGVSVILNGRDQQSLDATRKEIESNSGAKVFAMKADLSIPAERDRMIYEVLATHGKIDILVTNTGGPPTGKMDVLTQADWDNAYQSLLASVVGLINGFVPGMKKQSWGRIIAITSITVKQPVNNLMLSNSLRAAVSGLVKTLSNELGPHNITVNSVLPGYTETERLKQLIELEPSFSNVIKEIPLGRLGKPEEFAAAVAFLASERAAFITGTALPVDGGWIKSVF